MNNAVSFEKVDFNNFQTYILVGKNAYNEHYRHLWRYGNPSPYVSRGFTLSALARDLGNPLHFHYIIRKAGMAVGVLKVILDRVVPPYRVDEVVFLEKVYLLKEHTGAGTGLEALRFVEDYGRRSKKKFLVLDAMQKGPATKFYMREGFTVLREKLLEHPDAVPDECPMFVLTKPL